MAEPLETLIEVAVDPYRFRQRILEVVRRTNLGSYEWRVDLGAVDRPAYAYCVRGAANLAKSLQIPSISVIEFGVAKGRGLLSLEEHARRWSELCGVAIEVYGFDTGSGLPPVTDYRDVPYHWQGGYYRMDVEALQERLANARLVLGDVRETVASFLADYNPPPVGAVMFDLDFYTSTMAALRLFDLESRHRLPRVFLYFDDIVGTDVSLYSDYAGERLAIAEFNELHASQKISPVYELACRGHLPWHHQVYALHDFDHDRYGDFVSRPWLGHRSIVSEDARTSSRPSASAIARRRLASMRARGASRSRTA
jgi:hypothetical protein